MNVFVRVNPWIRTCTTEEKTAAGCHDSASCQTDGDDKYLCQCPEGFAQQNSARGPEGCSHPLLCEGDECTVECDGGGDIITPITGSGWKHVRHVPQGSNWHPATDDLMGTDAYGSHLVETAPWTVPFSHVPFVEFLFVTGDCQRWLVASRDAVIGEHYSNTYRDIVESADSHNAPYQAQWYNRGVKEDPWVSLQKHGVSANDMVYGEGGHSGHNTNVDTRGGANVYIRTEYPWEECSAAEKAASDCNEFAACEIYNGEYRCTCPTFMETRNSGTGTGGCFDLYPNCTASIKEALCPNSPLCIVNKDYKEIDPDTYSCCETTSDCKLPECSGDEVVSTCHFMSACNKETGSVDCICPEGLYGNGEGEVAAGTDNGCNSNAWTVRVTINLLPTASGSPATPNGKLASWEEEQPGFARVLWNIPDGGSLASVPSHYLTSMHHVVTLATTQNGADQLTINTLFRTKDDAKTAAGNLLTALTTREVQVFGVVLNVAVAQDERRAGAFEVDERSLAWGPEVYTWVAGTTSDETRVRTTGMEVTSVFFDTTCEQSGCWVVDVTYTVGDDSFNVFYLPRSANPSLPLVDTLAYDYDYSTVPGVFPWTLYAKSPESTFSPSNFPCSSTNYNPGDSIDGTPPDDITACCLIEFSDMYRPVDSFSATGSSSWRNVLEGLCSETPKAVPFFARPNFDNDAAAWDMPASALDGTFADLTSCSVSKVGVIDPFIGIEQARFYLDEVELRQLAGMLKGTVGVEHTVDTYVGFSNFRVTGIMALDAMATQVNLHLEKTSFFSVSTHGTNAYTFLEYVNMRLVTIYKVDNDFSGTGASTGAGAGEVNDDEATAVSVRTNSTGNVCYVQVTFTMGSQYRPNTLSGGLIPLDSVRAGKGTFFDDVNTGTPTSDGDLTHVCDGYPTTSGSVGVYGFEVAKSTLTGRLAQDCAPQASMCVTPADVPDQFVVFNIPLGAEVFEDPADDLSNNIFVDMVVNAIDLGGGATPNMNQSPKQMKTTLTASIPIVSGGVNVFCDGVTAKTDLKDVANADVIVGSAANSTELTRLRILQDIASTQLAQDDLADNVIDSDSIEAGLLTLVLKGNSSYFASGIAGSNTLSYSMELDDVITIHIMQDGEAPTATQDDGSAMGTVMELLATPADDNSDTNGLDVDGYQLNGAFLFSVTRNAEPGKSRAVLEPTDALKAVCPFNPPRPAPGTTPLETCITRRDVRSRAYPTRTGADETTAMEIASFAEAGAASPSAMTEALVDSYLDGAGSDAREAEFMVSILGDNDYARQLAVDYAKAIHERYGLNGRYMRAFWINPGYEWTPTQTAGKSLFQVSQKIYLFALISLDENWGVVRRRMLLQTAAGDESLQEAAAGVGSTEVSFTVNPTSLLAQSFEVPIAKVAKFQVDLQLTKEEACMSPTARQAALMETFEDYLSSTASAFHTVQVTSVSVAMNGETCDRRRRQLKADFSSATAEVSMVVVFKESVASTLNLAAFAAMPGVEAVTPAQANADIEYPDDYVAPPNKDAASDDDDDHVALIAGIAGGVGGAIVVAGLAALFFKKCSSGSAEAIASVQSINVADLKQQLSEDA